MLKKFTMNFSQSRKLSSEVCNLLRKTLTLYASKVRPLNSPKFVNISSAVCLLKLATLKLVSLSFPTYPPTTLQ